VRKIQGLYNNHGYVQIRIWPWPKVDKPEPYVEKGFGCWCQKHKLDAAKRLRVLRDEIDSGKFAKIQDRVEWLFPTAWDYFFESHYLKKKRSKKSVLNAKSNGKLFKSLWPKHWISQMSPKAIKEDWLDKSAVGPGTLRGRMNMLEGMFDELERLIKLKIIDPPVHMPDFNPVTPFEKPSGKYHGKKHLSQSELVAYKNWTLANDPDLWVASYYAMTTLLRHGDLKNQAGLEGHGVAEKTGKAFNLPVKVPRAANLPNFTKRWAAARKACNIVWFHWHWWRAQGGKVMRWQGVDEKTVQELYQHSSIQQTREYTGDPEWAKPAIETVKDFLDKLGSSNNGPSA
jgi:hypothetical protein